MCRVRIGLSPLWEVAGSLAVLTRGRSAPWPYDTWCRTARREIARRPAAQLVDWYLTLSGPLPGALTPVPPTAEPSLEDELAALCRAPTPADPLPPGGVGWFADAVAQYWQAAVQPYWPTMRAGLQEDVLRRAHTLATQGAEAVVSHLDDRCRWVAGSITVPGATRPETVHCSRQLVVVSLLFGRSGTRCVPDPSGLVAVSCQARGAAVLERNPVGTRPDAAAEPEPGDRLAIVVGRSRAAVLRALVLPSTTSVVASSLGLSTSTVSEHLSALVAAGMVSRRRLGSRVLYSLDRAGTALLGHLDSIRLSPNSSQHAGADA